MTFTIVAIATEAADPVRADVAAGREAQTRLGHCEAANTLREYAYPLAALGRHGSRRHQRPLDRLVDSAPDHECPPRDRRCGRVRRPSVRK